MSFRSLGSIVVVALGLSAHETSAQSGWPGALPHSAEACTPYTGDAASWLRRADSATGRHELGDRLLRARLWEVNSQTMQSDRTYPPFILLVNARQLWFDPRTGVERIQAGDAATAPGRSDLLMSASAGFVARDTSIVPNPMVGRFAGAQRWLNPHAALSDWRESNGVRVAGRCVFRDYPRVVLERSEDKARLYLDEKTGMPVKVDVDEPHFLWGQVRASYVYATWWRAGGVVLPVGATRLVDGVEDISRSYAQIQDQRGVGAATRDSAPSMVIPAGASPARRATWSMPFADPVNVDTVRVSSSTYLLKTPMYTHAVTLARDTVFLLDATTSEARSRADSVWIAKLFPGNHPMVLVVTDLAWPHISGVRFWVARGAQILTHRLSKAFLEEVLARRWTMQPDALESQRKTVRPVIRTTAESLALGGGDLIVAPIDGVASEGALMVMIPRDRFLWAGDYIQTVTQPSQYAGEVAAAVRRTGFAPQRTAAQHLPLTAWSIVEAIVRAPSRFSRTNAPPSR